MKKILIVITDGMVERNLLKTEFLSSFLSAKKTEVYLIVDSELYFRYLKKEYSHLPLEIIYECYTPSRFDYIFFHLFQQSIHTHTVRENQWNLYKSIKSGIGYNTKISLPTYLFFRSLWHLGKLKIWRKSLRFLYRIIPNSYFKETLKRIKPDLVFVPSVNYADYRILRQAKKAGLKTVQMIKSWDNLTSKTFLATVPDYLIVHNEIIKKEAITLDDMEENKIFVSGIPQFDFLIKNQDKLLESRKEFYEKLGIDPSKKVLLYCASGDWLNPYDEEILLGIHNAISEKRFIYDLHVQVRAHPKYKNKFDKIKKMKEFTIDRPFTYLNSGYKNWVFEKEEMKHWFNSIYHSEIVINTASSMSIDAAIIDKPVICIGFDGKEKLPYNQSVLRFYSRDHYANLIKTGGVDLVKNNYELIESINNYLRNPGHKKEERRLIVKQQCYKLNGESSKIIADFLFRLK